jgi:hypothetical protein
VQNWFSNLGAKMKLPLAENVQSARAGGAASKGIGHAGTRLRSLTREATETRTSTASTGAHGAPSYGNFTERHFEGR